MMMERSIYFEAFLGELADVPGMPFSYWATKSLRDLFTNYPPLDRDISTRVNQPKLADVKQGLATADDLRFVRYWWEVAAHEISQTREETPIRKWVVLSKNGKAYFNDIAYVINWENDGYEIKHFKNAVIRNESFYFNHGLAWPNIVGTKNLQVFILPPTIFTHVAPAIFYRKEQEREFLLSLLNSELFWFLFHMLDPMAHHCEVGTVARLPINEKVNLKLSSLCREILALLQEWETGRETSTFFCQPFLLQAWSLLMGEWDESKVHPLTDHPLSKDFSWSELESVRRTYRWIPANTSTHAFSLRSLAEICVQRESFLRQYISRIQSEIDEEVYCLYKIGSGDRAVIKAELGQAVAEFDEDSDGTVEAHEEEIEPSGILTIEEHLKRLLHYLAYESLKADDDGIVPLRDTYLSDGRLEIGLVNRVRENLADIFGAENLSICEHDLQSALGMPLEAWLETEFFSYNTGLYRLRPIIWQIVSRPRGTTAFTCFVYWHKLDEDTLRKINQVFLRSLIESARRESSRLGVQLAEKRSGGAALRLVRDAERASRQAEDRLNELEGLQAKIQSLLQSQSLSALSRSAWVIEKVKEIMVHGYRPVRDFGVRVNIEPLKKAGILPVAAERVKG